MMRVGFQGRQGRIHVLFMFQVCLCMCVCTWAPMCEMWALSIVGSRVGFLLPIVPSLPVHISLLFPPEVYEPLLLGKHSYFDFVLWLKLAGMGNLLTLRHNTVYKIHTQEPHNWITKKKKKHQISHKVLCKVMIVCWASSRAIPQHMWVGHIWGKHISLIIHV